MRKFYAILGLRTQVVRGSRFGNEAKSLLMVFSCQLSVISRCAFQL